MFLIHSKNVIQEVAKLSSNIGLFLSFGKDSIVMADLVCSYGNFKKVSFCYKHFVPDLEHLNQKRKEVLDYFIAKYPNIEFDYCEVPDTITCRAKRQGIYCEVDKKFAKKIPKWKDQEKEFNSQTGADFFGWGIKASDSLDRMITLQNYEMQAIDKKSKRFYPLAKWTQKQVFKYLEIKNLPKPIKYSNSKMTGIGLNKQTAEWLEAFYPQDLEKVRGYFPYFYF